MLQRGSATRLPALAILQAIFEVYNAPSSRDLWFESHRSQALFCPSSPKEKLLAHEFSLSLTGIVAPSVSAAQL